MDTPPTYFDILNDLNREVFQAQPKDVYQFCANYFNRKLEEQRVKLLANGMPQTYSDWLSWARVISTKPSIRSARGNF